MFNVSVRKILVSSVAIAAVGALSFGASSEAWGGKTTAWESRSHHSNAGKTTAWEARHHSTAGKTTAWEFHGKRTSGKTTAWE